MPQLGRLSSQGLAGLSTPSSPPPPSISWSSYSVLATTGLTLNTTMRQACATNGTVAFFTVEATTVGATNKTIKFTGSSLVEVNLPAPSYGNATPKFVAYGGGRFVLMGHQRSNPFNIVCTWVSTDGGNTFTAYTFSHTQGIVRSIQYLNNTFYMLFYDNALLCYKTSSDGITWSSTFTGGTVPSGSPLITAASSGTRIFSRGYTNNSSTNYQRLVPPNFNSVTLSTPVGSNGNEQPCAVWLRGFGFVLVTNVVGDSVYSITQAGLDSGAQLSVWSTPGTNFGDAAVADNGISTPVIVFRDTGFNATAGKASFDGGTTFYPFTLPPAVGGSFPYFMSGSNGNKIFITNYQLESPGYALGIYVGTTP